MKASTGQSSPVSPTSGWIVFLLIAVTGLFYLKWFPYYNRAFVAATTHSIGSSILMGDGHKPAGAVVGRRPQLRAGLR